VLGAGGERNEQDKAARPREPSGRTQRHDIHSPRGNPKLPPQQRALPDSPASAKFPSAVTNTLERRSAAINGANCEDSGAPRPSRDWASRPSSARLRDIGLVDFTCLRTASPGGIEGPPDKMGEKQAGSGLCRRNPRLWGGVGEIAGNRLNQVSASRWCPPSMPAWA